MDLTRWRLVLGCGMLALAPGLVGQALGAPVNFSPNAIPGIEIAAEWRPEHAGDARVSVHLAKVTVGASYGIREDDRSAWSATVGYPLLRSVAWEYALSLEAGYGEVFGADASSDRQLSLGIAAALNPEGIGAALIPWTAVSYRHLWYVDAESQPALSVSLGIEVRTAALLPKLGRLGGLSLYSTWEVVMPFQGGLSSAGRSAASIGFGHTLGVR